eukprot:GFUD01025919.1.p1 GENE.GFUD01025919.1~~GFUD01025919.1.p1  ORF type:complete len:298 (+),score=92.14 GFUD01025919.1:52-945(+)
MSHVTMSTSSTNMSTPSTNVSPLSFTLLVHGKLIHCTSRVIVSSSLFLDMVELVEDTNPIPIPTFISRQIMLDLVEMVEKDDSECAHLILVSLEYLLDFLIAVDFLGCEGVKAVLEEKIKDKITESNWKKVFNYTKNILGLVNTTKNSMTPICTRLVEGKNSLSMAMERFNCQCTPSMLKLVLKNDCLGGCLKFDILKNWFLENSEAKGEILSMLKSIQFKELEDSKVEEIRSEVKTWNIGKELENSFKEVIETAKKERELDRERVRMEWREKRKLFRPRMNGLFLLVNFQEIHNIE